MDKTRIDTPPAQVKLEKLISAYEGEIFSDRPSLRKLSKLCVQVEDEANRIGYAGHIRLQTLHSLAEAVGA